MDSSLYTQRTITRPYVEEDVDLMFPIFSDPITMAFWPEPFTHERVEAWVRRAIDMHDRIGLGRMVVRHRDSGEVIGDCGIMQSEVNGETEYDLGYIIHHPYWRQGYAYECAASLLEYGRDKGLRRIVANMAHDHIGSQRVAEKLGMAKVGEFINARNRGILTCLYVDES